MSAATAPQLLPEAAAWRLADRITIAVCLALAVAGVFDPQYWLYAGVIMVCRGLYQFEPTECDDHA